MFVTLLYLSEYASYADYEWRHFYTYKIMKPGNLNVINIFNQLSDSCMYEKDFLRKNSNFTQGVKIPN